MNNDPTTWHARMPLHNDTTVPKWDESYLRELPQYFKELEYLFADCGITDNTQKKDGLATLGRFSDYYRDFQCIARWLLTNSKLYHNEECCLFQQGIPTSLWSKIICCLEITLPDHHPEDPYDIDQVFEGAKWVLKGTDTSMTKTSNGTSGISLPLPIANAPVPPLPMPKWETLELVTTTAVISALECLEALLTNGNTQPCQQFANNTCHFCSETGHTMVQGTCMKLEQMIQQGKIHHNAEGKIILLLGAMIPNYFGKQLYMECIEEWHRLNLGQIVTSRLSSNANPDPDQAAMQQSLIHKFDSVQVLHVAYQLANNTPRATPLTSNTLATPSPSDSTPAPAAKPADKGKAHEHTVANEQPPVTKEPIAQPPIHLFSNIPGHYVPPANRNFATPDRSNDGAY
ncbi:hypothetical protein C0989_001830 [Termitomyces sp. Mn162]|nr:hypothetical protein C0989_001830 [Termitomyces sp. Mn162]